MKRRGMTIAAAFVAGAMMLAGGGIAYADVLDLSSDNLEVENEVNVVDLGAFACGATEGISESIKLEVRRNGSVNSGNVFRNSSVVTFTVDNITPSGSLTAGTPSPQTVTLSSTWTTNPAPSERKVSAPAYSTVTVPTTTEGSYTTTVRYRASGFNTDNEGFSRTQSVTIKWQVGSCVQEPPADTTAPVVDLTCPSSVEIGSVAYATWVATDAGGFADGVETSGSLLLETGTWGDGQTASLPAGFIVDKANNPSAAASCNYDVKDSVPPEIRVTCPDGPFLLGQAVPAVAWQAVDPSPGSGIDETQYTTSGLIPVDTASVGAKDFSFAKGAVKDRAGNESAATKCEYSVVYDFTGFFRPVDMGGTLNSVKAGSAVPIKFSLGGDQGLGILDGAPTLKWIACSAGATVDPIEVTVSTAGGSSLSYDPLTNQYNYVWKTDKNWAGKCGTLQVKLNDGTTHTADFKLLK